MQRTSIGKTLTFIAGNLDAILVMWADLRGPSSRSVRWKATKLPSQQTQIANLFGLLGTDSGHWRVQIK